MAGSHLDQAYLGESADNSLIATGAAASDAPGGIDKSALVAAPIPDRKNIYLMGAAAGIATYLLCRYFQTRGK